MESTKYIGKQSSIPCFIKKNRGKETKELYSGMLHENLLDSSLHSFDPNKSSPPNDFFMKSYLRLKNY